MYYVICEWPAPLFIHTLSKLLERQLRYKVSRFSYMRYFLGLQTWIIKIQRNGWVRVLWKSVAFMQCAVVCPFAQSLCLPLQFVWLCTVSKGIMYAKKKKTVSQLMSYFLCTCQQTDKKLRKYSVRIYASTRIIILFLVGRNAYMYIYNGWLK
jgi:hypothetical protein